MPPGAVYDSTRGYWVKDGKPMVLNPEYRPTTKKHDIETGEDMKGA